MITIHKYKLPDGIAAFKIGLPAESKIMMIKEQNGTPTMWCQVDTDKPVVYYTFVVVGTGFDLDETVELVGDELYYLDSIIGNVLVLHYYVVLNKDMIDYPLQKMV